MTDVLGNLLVLGLYIFIILSLTFVLLLAIFIFFACGVWLGAFCGYLLSFTPMGQWVHSALIALGADLNLAYLGALLGFIGSLFNIKLVNPVITAVSSRFLGQLKDKDSKRGRICSI
jgi:hypothetical protein